MRVTRPAEFILHDQNSRMLVDAYRSCFLRCFPHLRHWVQIPSDLLSSNTLNMCYAAKRHNRFHVNTKQEVTNATRLQTRKWKKKNSELNRNNIFLSSKYSQFFTQYNFDSVTFLFNSLTFATYNVFITIVITTLFTVLVTIFEHTKF